MTAKATPLPISDDMKRHVVRQRLSNPLHQATTVTYWIGEENDRLLVTITRPEHDPHNLPRITVEDRTGVIAQAGPCSIEKLLDEASAILAERIWGDKQTEEASDANPDSD